MKRRAFLGFFLFGGLISLLKKKLPLKGKARPKEAMFWTPKQ